MEIFSEIFLEIIKEFVSLVYQNNNDMKILVPKSKKTDILTVAHLQLFSKKEGFKLGGCWCAEGEGKNAYFSFIGYIDGKELLMFYKPGSDFILVNGEKVEIVKQ